MDLKVSSAKFQCKNSPFVKLMLTYM